MAKMKMTGHMDPHWLSTIGKSAPVTNVITDTASEVKTRAEAKAATRTKSGYSYHYGSTTRKGIWGTTVVIHPISNIAFKHREMLRAAASGSGTKLKKEKTT